MIWTETSGGLFPSEIARTGAWTLILWRSWRGCGWFVSAPGHRVVDGIESTRDAACAAAAAAVLARAADGDLSAHERAALTIISQRGQSLARCAR
ncbi:hypothetical protein ABAZ39_11485 [Azospirillum argentinense]|uniref:Uncharacterized protein n=1 Tax=Azospirillum argentinense TaxID=2970906 RepID=A0A060DNX6_9PROT|nr:hypothetical protein ABAZ39_11485 [Azospirillum argentinense]EZQ09854.1 hypothetical protein ABAZ39_12915 [Azospirillum argentinense]